jgi:hypothetical protein
VISIRRFFLIWCILLCSFAIHAQVSTLLSQKIFFQKQNVTIGEILKELIHAKNINLSYSPDALNLEEEIHLPAKELLVKDVLYLIGHKPGNKLLIHGNQVIIKKEKVNVSDRVPINKKSLINEGKDTIIIREAAGEPLLKRNISFARISDSLNSSLNQLLGIPRFSLQKDLTKPVSLKKDNAKSVSVKKVSQTGSLFSKGYKLSAGSGVGLAYLTHISDSGQNIRVSPAVTWNLRTDFEFQLKKNCSIGTGIGFNQANYDLKSNLTGFFITDSSRLDSVIYQNIRLKVNSLEIPILINYVFDLNGNHIIVGLGGSFRYALNGKRVYNGNLKSDSQNVSWNTPSQPVSVLNNMTYLTRMNYNILGQIGYQQNKWKIIADAKIGINSFSNYEKGRSWQFSLTFIYQLLSKK